MAKKKVLKKNFFTVIFLVLAILLLWGGMAFVKPYMEEKERELAEDTEKRKRIAMAGSDQLVTRDDGRNLLLNRREKEAYDKSVASRTTGAQLLRPRAVTTGDKKEIKTEEFMRLEAGDMAFRYDLDDDAWQGRKYNPFKPYDEKKQFKTSVDLPLEYKGYIENGGERMAVIVSSGQLFRVKNENFVQGTSFFIRDIQKNFITVADMNADIQVKVKLNDNRKSENKRGKDGR